MSNREIILQQVLSRKRTINKLLEMMFTWCVLFARRASPCSALPTLRGTSSAVLASSPGDACRVLFSLGFILTIVPISRAYSFLRVYQVYMSISLS